MSRPIYIYKGTVTDRFEQPSFSDAQAKIGSLNRSLVIVKFLLNKFILRSNKKNLEVMKYSLDEITNHLHCIFIDEDPTKTAKYAAFWAGLKAGRDVTGEFLRFDETKNLVWLEARTTRS